MKSTSLWFALLLAPVAATGCGSANDPPVGGTPSGGSGAAARGATGGTTAPNSPGTGGLAGSQPSSSGTAEALSGSVQVTAAKTVAAGTTLSIRAGTTVTLANDVALTVLGTLIVEGTQQTPVRLQGASATASSWQGIVIGAGGTVTASWIEIHGAQVGIDARLASHFQIDHVLIDTTTQALSLASNGKVAHGVLRGLGADQSGPAIVVDSASPQVVDTLVNQGSYGAVDLIIVNGDNAGPLFDHVEVADSHCAFHVNSGSGMTISNSYIHHNAYGMMVGALAGLVISHDNFQDNLVNLGSCSFTATAQVSGDFFAGPATDGSCPAFQISNSSSAALTTDVGPRP